MLDRRYAHLLVLLTATGVAGPLHAQPVPADAAGDVTALQRQLLDRDAKGDQREIAAQRLLSRPDPQARAILRQALADSNPAVPLAAARALADQPTADPSLIELLFARLDAKSSEPLIRAAAQALTAFKTDAGVLSRLLALTEGGDPRVRLASVQALGTFVEKAAAARLVELCDPTRSTPALAAGADTALAYLTGFDASTVDSAGWRNWWEKNQGKPDAQFRLDLATSRSARFDRVRVSSEATTEAIRRLLDEQYQQAAAAGRTDEMAAVLLRYLRSSNATFRAVGCQVANEAAPNYLTPPAVKEQLRLLVGDGYADVRRLAAETLAVVADREAVPALLTQLAQENDPGVRAAIAGALGPANDVRAVGPLADLLLDASDDTARAAAGALGRTLSDRNVLAAVLAQTPGGTARTANALYAALKDRTGPQRNTDLRNELVKALAPLRHPPLEQPLTQLLAATSRETAPVRRSLLTTLGAYGDPKLVDAISPWVNDPDDKIRLAAIQALGQTTSNVVAYGRPLRDRMNPALEPSREVRDAAWKALSGMFPKAPTSDLISLENRLKDDAPKLLVLVKQERVNYARAGDAKEAAERDQWMGDLHFNLQQYGDAAAAYQTALDYARLTNDAGLLSRSGRGLLSALLKSRQFPQAVGLVVARRAEATSEDPQGELGPIIVKEAESLTNGEKNYDLADQLIDQIFAMEKPLAPRFTGPLQELKTTMAQLRKQKSRLPEPGSDAVLTASLW